MVTLIAARFAKLRAAAGHGASALAAYAFDNATHVASMDADGCNTVCVAFIAMEKKSKTKEQAEELSCAQCTPSYGSYPGTSDKGPPCIRQKVDGGATGVDWVVTEGHIVQDK